MNLDDAIEVFQSKRKGQYSLKDRSLILAIGAELGLVEFEIKLKYNSSSGNEEHYMQYIFDEEDVVHFHPEMIVSRVEFIGFDPKTESKYQSFPFMAKLSQWKSYSDSELITQVCPNCFLQLPLSGICGVCDLAPDEVEVP